jgi:hypothetical protein
MNGNRHTGCDRNIVQDDFVAELTRAAYAVALRNGRRRLWLDLELELWRVLTDLVQKWGQGPPRCPEEALVPD